MIRRFSAAVLILPVLAFAPTSAHAEIYVFDAGHTRVEYSVNHLGFSDVPGIFNDIKGKLDFDPGKPENASVEATINASSVTMNHGMLDHMIQGGNFFNTSKYPTITFKSTDIDRTGSATGTVVGHLTLLGVTRPVTLNVTFNKKAWDKYAGADAVGFTATTKIHRSDFGMKAFLPDVGDDVTIKIDVEALKAKPVDFDTMNDKAAQTKVINTTKKADDETSDAAKPAAKATDKPAADATPSTPAVVSPAQPAQPITPPPHPTAHAPAKARIGAF